MGRGGEEGGGRGFHLRRPSASPQLVQLVGDALQFRLDGSQALQLLVLQRKPRACVSSCRRAAIAPQSYGKPCLGLAASGGTSTAVSCPIPSARSCVCPSGQMSVHNTN